MSQYHTSSQRCRELIGRCIFGAATVFAFLFAPPADARHHSDPSPFETPPLRFDAIGEEVKIPSPHVEALVEDSAGFVWFGTRHGLSLYDGYDTTTYFPSIAQRSAAEHSLAMPADWILALEASADGAVWFANVAGEVFSWHHGDDEPVFWDHEGIAGLPLRSIHPDDVGGVWLGTRERGLFLYRPAGGRVRRFPLDGVTIWSILGSLDEKLWIGTTGGLYVLTSESGSPTMVPGTGELDIRILRAKPDGGFLIGTRGNGLWVMDDGSFEVRQLDDPGAAHRQISSIATSPRGTIWVGTDHGLLRRDPVTAQWTEFHHDPNNTYTIPSDRVRALLVDSNDTLWVATSGGGVARLRAHGGLFSTYLPSRAPSATPGSVDAVTGIEQDPTGALWISVHRGGLHVVPPGRTEVEAVELPLDETGRKPAIQPTDLRWAEKHGGLLIGTQLNGLWRIRPGDRRAVPYSHPSIDSGTLDGFAIVRIHEQGNGDIWLGTQRNGIVRLPRNAADRLLFPRMAESLQTEVRAIAEANSGTLIVGTASGLGVLREPYDEVRPLEIDPSLSIATIYDITRATDGSFWIGTDRGLAQVSPFMRAPEVSWYTVADGLPSNSIASVREDDDGAIWVSSGNGLGRIDPENRQVTSLSTWHGLPTNEFMHGAMLRTTDDLFFVGSSRGLVRFDPRDFRPNDRDSPIRVTSVSLPPDEIIDFPREGNPAEIRLTHRQPVLAIRYTLLDFSAPRWNQYRFMLEGFDPSWRGPTRDSSVMYTNLPPGDYTFRVRGANADGHWSTSEATLAVTMLPPPWLTWWAFAFYAAVIIAAIYGYTRYQADKLHREEQYARRLEHEVAERTQELEERNRRLEYANKMLEIASVTDSLTGLHNRRFLLTSMEQDLALAKWEGDSPDTSYLFVVLDLDQFKRINDTYGHPVGDLVLFQVRDRLTQVCRAKDTLIRWGGDEFLIVGRDAGEKPAQALAERVRRVIGDEPFDVGRGKTFELTCSVGFATFPFVESKPDLCSWEQVIDFADRALYIAKRAGRNEWVGIFGTERTPETPVEDLLMLIDERPELLAQEGSISLRSSIRDAPWERVAGA